MRNLGYSRRAPPGCPHSGESGEAGAGKEGTGKAYSVKLGGYPGKFFLNWFISAPVQ